MSKELSEEMREHFLAAGPKLRAAEVSNFDRYMQLAATMTTLCLRNPLDFAMSILRGSLDKERARFAFFIGKILGSMNADERGAAWKVWLERYWRERIANIPTPLESAEAETMQTWLVDLHELYPTVVPLAIQMHIPIKGAMILYRLKNSELPANYADETLTYLTHITPLLERSWLGDVTSLAKSYSGGSKIAKEKLCNALLTAGHSVQSL